LTSAPARRPLWTIYSNR